MNTSPTEARSQTTAPHVHRAGPCLIPQSPRDRPAAAYELRFCSLFDVGRALAFPCDERGHVDLDALSPRALNNYYYARTVVGREFCTPAVLPNRPQ